MEHFKCVQAYKMWHKRYCGKKAGNRAGRYEKIGIFQKYYTTHRLVYIYHKGYEPKQIDHINGNKFDNRIENLRAATNNTNKWNAKLHSGNTSGIKGVTYRDGVYEVYINARKKRYYLGRFKYKKDAARVIRAAREKLHGRWARFS